jgi:tetratricopeptide (TPR) repeat protein
MFRVLFGYLTPAASLLSGVVAVLTWFNITPDYFGIRPHLQEAVGYVAPDLAADETPGASFDALFEKGRQAARHRRWNEAVGYYERALATPGMNAERRVEATDAMGYAYYRDGRFDKAAAAIEQALAVQPAAINPRVNRIKVMCARNEPPVAVAAALAGLRAEVAGDYRRRRDVETDGELFRVCAYAGASPQP